VCKRAGLRNVRIYDLRHTFAAMGAGGGLGLPLIGRLLGHTQARTTQRYAHLGDDPLREAADKIAAAITGAGKGGKIVRLRGGS
jgi:integrase